MKVKHIIREIHDPKTFVELQTTLKKSGVTFGTYTKSELFYNDKLQNMTVKGITAQYYDNKRIIVLEVQ